MLERIFLLRYLMAKTKGSVVRTIALISVGGISLGVLAMVVVLSVMNGFDEAIKGRLLGVEPHIVVTDATASLQKKIESVIENKGSVERFSRQDVIIRTTDGIFSGAIAQGFESESLKHLTKRVRHSVEVFEDSQGVRSSTKTGQTADMVFSLGAKEIALGVELARSLGIFEGDEVNVVAPESLLFPTGELPLFEKVRVKALLRTDVPDIDNHMVFYDVAFGLRKLSDSASLEKGYEIRLKDPNDAESLSRAIKKLTSETVHTWQDLNAPLFYSLKMEKSLMALFLALTVIVSSFSIVSVLFILVAEKRMDVGILKTMGATKKQIRRIFITIGSALGLLGIGGGTIVGLGVCEFLRRYPIIKLPDIYYDTSVPVRVDKFLILGIIVLGSVLTLAGTVLPAWRTADADPIASIRHDDG